MPTDACWSLFAGKLAKLPNQKISESTEAMPARHAVQPLGSPLPLVWAMPFVPTDECLGPLTNAELCGGCPHVIKT
jgi:hypothetical protein